MPAAASAAAGRAASAALAELVAGQETEVALNRLPNLGY